MVDREMDRWREIAVGPSSFVSAYCRKDPCTLQILAASCQKRLPVEIGPVNTAVARMITPQGYGEGENNHSRVQI